MKTATLGSNGPALPRIGYGAMVLEGTYGASDENQALATLSHAMDRGLMIDSADAYGNGHNEELIGKALVGRDDTPFIASKFGIVFDPDVDAREVATGWDYTFRINASPDYARAALGASLERLGLETLDLWYLHVPDPEVAIEETVAAMAGEVQAGRVKYLGLSNVSAEQVRAAHAVHPISAVQYEYSLWRREAEEELLPTLRELGIALVAWSPLGGGFLTGNIKQLAEGDFRHNIPKFSADNLAENQARFAQIVDIADELGVSPSQLALAWLLSRGHDVFPIPGTRRAERIDENLNASSVALTGDISDRINEITAPGSFKGGNLL